MTKKAVEIITRPKGFLQKKHPAFSPTSVMEQQRPDSLQYEKESSEWVLQERSSKPTTKCPVRRNLT